KMGGIVGGEYSPAGRIITLFKEGGNELTAVHEVLHHTERMLPDALQAAVRKEWARQVTKVLPTVEGDARKLLQDLLVGKANPDKVMELVGAGKIPYALLNPSEFWAVNASRIVSGRYAAFNAGLVAKAKQWLTEFVQKAKSLFGLSSDAALIRGLDDVLKGDGTFVSKMLAEGEVFRSVTKADPTDYEAGKAFATAEVERLVAAGESRVGAARRVIDDLPRRLADMSDRDLGVRDALSGASSEAKSRGLVPSGRRAARAAEAAPSPEFVAAKETQLQALDALAEARKRARAEGYDVWSGRTPAYLDEAEEVYRKAKGEVERLIESRPLKQLGAGGEVKGMVLNEKGKNVIVLFENADASTVLHEVAHIVRSGVLSQNDMDVITKWITSKGVKVTHQYGEFVGDAAAVERAEELFAQAFEEYVRLGRAPTTRLENVFDVLKTAVAHVYRNVVGPVIGKGLDPEVQRVFDNLLSEVPADAAPSIKEIIRREMLGGAEAGSERTVLDYLSREATRKGIPLSTVDDLTEKFERAAAQAEIASRVSRGESLKDAAESVRKKYLGSKTKDLTPREKGIAAAVANPKATPDQVYLSFPVPVNGKKDWTIEALSDVQRQLDLGSQTAKLRERGILLDLTGRKSRAAGGEIIEETPLEKLRAAIAADDVDGKLTAQTKTLLRGVTFTFFGGDVVGETGLRSLPPALRKSVDTSARIIDQSLNDIVALTNDAVQFNDSTSMYRYLGGAADVRRLNGRPIVSAGYDYMGSVQQMMRRMIESMPDDQKAALQKLCDAANLPQPARGRAFITLGFDESLSFSAAEAAKKAATNAAVRAVMKLVMATEGAGEADFGTAFTTALRSAIGDVPPGPRPSHEFMLAEAMSYVAGFTARNGELFKGTSEEAARIFLTDVSKIYQSEETGRRVAVIVGGYGAASLGKDVMVKMNLGISPEAYKAFNNWLVGEQWDPRYTTVIQRIVDEYGFNPQFVSDNILDSTVYIPRAARERMVNSLARTTFKSSGEVGIGDGVGLAYRYMKVRMTRGNWFIKQRYYMMNTVDHFNQMGMQNGFGVAAASVSRVLMQDVMVLPVWQQVVDVAMRTKVGQRIGQAVFPGLKGPEILERFRGALQRMGDAAAYTIGSMFSTSKYRIEVNPILEGVEGGFSAGGKVYSYRDVRSIAVQEGIFSSFDASQLANAVQREGAIFFEAGVQGSTGVVSATGKGRLKNFFADWQNTVSDT
ncbi:MAG: Erwinia phage PEp14, partial [Actinomycetota bacterium]